jgi:hypothetical protein
MQIEEQVAYQSRSTDDFSQRRGTLGILRWAMTLIRQSRACSHFE